MWESVDKVSNTAATVPLKDNIKSITVSLQRFFSATFYLFFAEKRPIPYPFASLSIMKISSAFGNLHNKFLSAIHFPVLYPSGMIAIFVQLMKTRSPAKFGTKSQKAARFIHILWSSPDSLFLILSSSLEISSAVMPYPKYITSFWKIGVIFYQVVRFLELHLTSLGL